VEPELDRFNTIQSVYHEIDALDLSNLGKTPFYATPKIQIFQALKYLIQNGIISRSTTFIDLGSGTGVTTAIASYVFGLNAIGIEGDLHLYEIAIQLKSRLNQFTTDFDLEYIQADFTKVELFKELDNVIVFNYLAGDVLPVLDQLQLGNYFITYLMGGSLGLPLNRDQARQQLFDSASWSYASSEEKTRMINHLLEQYRSWRYLLNPPETAIYLYQKI